MVIKEFLLQFSSDELKKMGVLDTQRNLLNSNSVYPLIDLMKQNNITELTAFNWSLDENGFYYNSKAIGQQRGNIENLSQKGTVFLQQNKSINPYYNSSDYSSTNFEKSLIIQTDDSLFVNEDISKPENRINLSLFGLFSLDDFRIWFLNRLSQPSDAAIFPSVNLFGGIRPDYAIHDKNDKPIAYVEVEIGREDTAQLENFRNHIPKPVYYICGLKKFDCDISLEEIYEFLKDRNKPTLQIKKQIAYFEKLYYENVLNCGREHYKRTTISDEIRETPIVKTLMEHLPIHEEIGRTLYSGEITIETQKEHGFSLRIYSRISKSRNSFSVMARTGGRDYIIFPSVKKMNKYLAPNKRQAIQNYAALIKKFGLDLETLEEKQRGHLNIIVVREHIMQFIAIIKELSR